MKKEKAHKSTSQLDELDQFLKVYSSRFLWKTVTSAVRLLTSKTAFDIVIGWWLGGEWAAATAIGVLLLVMQLCNSPSN